MKRYGILIGRFQPLHLAHQSIINEIMHDGLTPLIFIGSSNKVDDKNPFSYSQRFNIIHSIYGDEVVTLPIADFPEDSEWVERFYLLLEAYNIDKSECSIYYYKKRVDTHDIFNLLPNFNYVRPKYPEVYGEISASDIRNNIEANKKYLDGRVYKQLKEKLYANNNR